MFGGLYISCRFLCILLQPPAMRHTDTKVEAKITYSATPAYRR